LITADTIEKVQLSYIIEFSPAIYYRFKPFYFTVAYDFFSFYNVAFAPYQIERTVSLNSILSSRRLRFDGFSAGLGAIF